MGNMDGIHKIQSQPTAHERAIVRGEKYRFTVLTSRMIRIEYSRDGVFEDRATQVVLNRNFEVPEFKVIEESDVLEIITKDIHLVYNKGEFTGNNLRIKVTGGLGAYHSIWRFGEELDDLRGTGRTLDGVNGSMPLQHGLLSKHGFSVIDDSRSLILREDGWIEPRKNDIVDMYFIGYGRDYLGCLRNFYYLCGNTPLLPRYALGNWWSRFHRYTEHEYKELMERFERENIPFSVAVIDMDWHITEVNPKHGHGWTGYTWNRELFPDPAEFMDWLHKKGLRVTLNVHPADGVRPHEEMYIDMAKDLGVDYENEEHIKFDITDQEFLKAYFKYLHHPNEKDGVDFWWIDWQQGTNTRISGLDPLWMLNHFHYLDSKRDGKRGLTFSRYSGLGSHRYPIGFSGDTIVTWESLDFQPYFTANASNVGYGWWSHDIGGHMMGYKDDELSVRWLQFGVFSPINRLHSTSSPFNSKEPWQYNLIAEKVMKNYLCLRHKLVPYLYTMNYLCNMEGLPLIQPMYYHSPWEEAAYNVKNQYYFGTELIVCPITSKINKNINQAHVTAWLPKGLWFDFFTGRIYEGDRMINLYRGIEHIPVFAKAGGIIPLSGDSVAGNLIDNPEELEVHVFAGAEGSFILYEDDGNSSEETNKGFAATKMKLDWNSKDKSAAFFIEKPEGHTEIIPRKREYNLVFTGFKTKEEPVILYNGERIKPISIKEDRNKIVIKSPGIDVNTEIKVLFDKVELMDNNYEEEIFDFLNKAQLPFDIKERIYWAIKKFGNNPIVMSEIQSINIESELLEAISEILWAYKK